MKKRLLFPLFLVLFSMMGIAQNQISLHIHHKLGTEDFALNAPATNNMGDDFKVTRLEYYISGISVVHDSGTVTNIDDLYILVNANTPTEVDLGNHPITNVEALHFTIGVDPEHNHLDPAGYDPSHPLAPKSPSMHWGWASGYRFLAFEGYGSSNYNQKIELHGLGDQNYIKTKLLMQVSPVNNEIDIHLDADYTGVLQDISVNSGIIVHGETMQAQQALVNLRNSVFTPLEQSTAIRPVQLIKTFEVFPNPTAQGYTNVTIETTSTDPLSIYISDLTGKQVTSALAAVQQNQIDLSTLPTGFYFINVSAEGRVVMSKQLIVK